MDPAGLEPATDKLPAPARPSSRGKLPRSNHEVKLKLYFSFRLLYIFHMVTSAQIRAARGLLKWTQVALAHKAAISVVTLNMIESDRVDPRASTLRSIEETLEKAGVEFIGSEQDGLGVRFRGSRGSRRI
jgi:DNA-binding XRE family transcriptional regulator